MAGPPMSCRCRMARCSYPTSRTARSTASPTPSDGLTSAVSGWWRPLVLGLAAVAFLAGPGLPPSGGVAPFAKALPDAEIEAWAKHFPKLDPNPSGEPIDLSLVKHGAKLAV